MLKNITRFEKFIKYSYIKTLPDAPPFLPKTTGAAEFMLTGLSVSSRPSGKVTT
jgi:hypothetical protein